MNALLLCILCITDAAFAGYRDAAGRDAHIFKDELYRRAIRRGLRAGLCVALAAGSLVAAVVLVAPSREVRLAELLETAGAMLPLLGGYATVVLVALGLWGAAEADIRTLASVTVLGLFTLLRPWFIVAAGVMGAWRAPSVAAAVTALVACGLQLMVGPLLARGWRDGRRPLG